MKAAWLALCASLAISGQSLAPQIKARAQSGDFNSARSVLQTFKRQRGVTPEYLEALSWIARAQLSAKRYNEANATAMQVRDLSRNMRPDSNPSLAIAIGASIEVQAQAAAAEGRRDEAVRFLRDELKRWHGASIEARIQKNLHLLDLEGKPAPALELTAALTTARLRPLSDYRGKPILLFFWAHWCSDCKQEAAIIERIQSAFQPRGLIVVAPTQHYGYAAGGAPVGSATETRYMRDVFSQYYSALVNIGVPVSEANFIRYGVSSTPTLVLIDGAGMVRLYHPGAMSYPDLASRIESITKR